MEELVGRTERYFQIATKKCDFCRRPSAYVPEMIRLILRLKWINNLLILWYGVRFLVKVGQHELFQERALLVAALEQICDCHRLPRRRLALAVLRLHDKVVEDVLNEKVKSPELVTRRRHFEGHTAKQLIEAACHIKYPKVWY